MKITREIARDLIDYNEDTGILTWRKRGPSWFSSERSMRSWNTKYSQKRAGYIWTNPVTGYQNRSIRVLGCVYFEHRLIWLWMTGEKPPEQIDHKNRDATDNRWENLRPSTNEENGKNQSRQINNTSGITGVHWNRSSCKWNAQGILNGKRVFIGSFEDVDVAAMEVLEFREENGYDRGHGLDVARYHKEEGKV